MKFYALLDELREELENSPKAVFSGKRSIEVEVFLEIVEDIRKAVPDEIKQAKKIIKDKERIAATAKKEADSIVACAEDELATRVRSEERRVGKECRL